MACRTAWSAKLRQIGRFAHGSWLHPIRDAIWMAFLGELLLHCVLDLNQTFGHERIARLNGVSMWLVYTNVNSKSGLVVQPAGRNGVFGSFTKLAVE